MIYEHIRTGAGDILFQSEFSDWNRRKMKIPVTVFGKGTKKASRLQEAYLLSLGKKSRDIYIKYSIYHFSLILYRSIHFLLSVKPLRENQNTNLDFFCSSHSIMRFWTISSVSEKISSYHCFYLHHTNWKWLEDLLCWDILMKRQLWNIIASIRTQKRKK